LVIIRYRKIPSIRKIKCILTVSRLNAMDGYRITLVEDDSGDDMVIYRYDDVKNIK